MKQRGTSYYWASLFFPKEMRDDVFVLYAFVRIADNIVDTPAISQQDLLLKREHLEAFRDLSLAIFQGQDIGTKLTKSKKDALVSTALTASTNQEHLDVIKKMSNVIQKRNIPLHCINDFFDAMHADTTQHTYTTYTDLQCYMNGSALAVGRMMTRIIGLDKSYVHHKGHQNINDERLYKEADFYGDLLAEAMQYTNFLRDIYEDYHVYGRIYLTQDRLKTYGLDHDAVIQLCTGEMSPEDARWQAFMKEQLSFVDGLYTQAYQGIRFLNPTGRKAVFLSGKLYQAIVKKIATNKYDVFTKSARTTKREKFKAVLPYVFTHEYTH